MCQKFLVIFTVAIAVAIVNARPQEKYTTKYDNVDLSEIIKSDRLMKNYVNCLLERGRCTPDGAELKRLLPDALASECSKCSEQQRNGSRRIIQHLIRNKPEWWNELEAKYDNTGYYRTSHQQEIDSLIY